MPRKKLADTEVNNSESTEALGANESTNSEIKSTEVDIPSVVTDSKSGTLKIPSFFQSKAFLKFSSQLDKVEKSNNCQSILMHADGYIKHPLSTGLLSYDLVLGGGYAGGRVHVEYGPEKSGKSSRAMTAIAMAVTSGKIPFFFDAETALDPSYTDRILMSKCGLTLESLQGVVNSKGDWEVPPVIRYYQNNMGKSFFDLLKNFLLLLPDVSSDRNGNYYKIIDSKYVEYDGTPQALALEDSIASLNPSADGDINDKNNQMASLARMLSKGFTQVKGLLGQKNVVLVLTNQVRQRPGVMFGPSVYMPGGPTLYHYTDMRAFTEPRHCKDAKLQCASLGMNFVAGKSYSVEPSLEGGEDKYNYQRIKIEKSKFYSAEKVFYTRTRSEHNGMPGDGIDNAYDIYQYLKMTNQIKVRAGSIILNVSGEKDDKQVPELLGANGAKMSWIKFKEFVTRDEFKHILENHCRKQLDSGYAFSLEAKNNDSSTKEEFEESSDE